MECVEGGQGGCLDTLYTLVKDQLVQQLNDKLLPLHSSHKAYVIIGWMLASTKPIEITWLEEENQLRLTTMMVGTSDGFTFYAQEI